MIPRKLNPYKVSALVLTFGSVLIPLVFPSQLHDSLLWIADILLWLLPDFLIEKIVSMGYAFDRFWILEKISFVIPLLVNCAVIILYYSRLAAKYVFVILVGLFILYGTCSLLFKLYSEFYVIYTFAHLIFSLVSASYAPFVLIPIINYLIKSDNIRISHEK